MVDASLACGLGVVAGFGLCILFYTLWHCWRHQQSHSQLQQQTNEAFEPLLPEDTHISQTLKSSSFARILLADAVEPELDEEQGNLRTSPSESGNSLILEVISGPAAGTRVSQQSLPSSAISVGRVPQNDLVLNDAEVSGRHAFITWNPLNSRWELVDNGSLNGTLLNHLSVSATQSANTSMRQRGEAVALADGDILKFGSTSEVLVQISETIDMPSRFSIASVPFQVGVAADPMMLRRTGRPLPMEDVSFYEWPLQGLEQFGAFCIFDGHGGATAAEAASKIMPQKLSAILKLNTRRAKVLNSCDATDVLMDAFHATEQALAFQYEGCTASVLLLWYDVNSIFYAQCANVGDSACIFSIGGKDIHMTEDHRLTSSKEKSRFMEMGKQLKDGETRLYGMNIARVLGDKCLKEQDERFSSQPFVSEVLKITRESKALGIIASDGLWDVISPKRALQIALEARERFCMDGTTTYSSRTAKDIAELIMHKARMLHTKDNTSVIVIDFVPYSK